MAGISTLQLLQVDLLDFEATNNKPAVTAKHRHALYQLVDTAETHWEAVAAYFDIEQASQRDASRAWRERNVQRNREQTRERVRRHRERKREERG